MKAQQTQPLTFQEEMSWLKKEIKQRGYYRKQPGRMVAEWLFLWEYNYWGPLATGLLTIRAYK